MNPMKLIGILKNGILSKQEAEKRGLVIDSKGLGCNGADYVSVATKFCGCGFSGRGAFHFIIESDKLLSDIRPNLQQDMPQERQVKSHVPIHAIKGIQLEKEGFMDIEHSAVSLGIGIFHERAVTQSQSYINFMASEFAYKIPIEELSTIEKGIEALRNADKEYIAYYDFQLASKKLEKEIESVIKSNLKKCFSSVLSKNEITSVDIIRYFDSHIAIYNPDGIEVNASLDINAIQDELCSNLVYGKIN
jgi:hypothetical protein